MRRITHAVIGIGNVLIVVIFIIGCTIISGTLFHDERSINAGMSVGSVLGLGLGIVTILVLKKMRDRWASE
jgi:hypothetical protein